MTVYILIKGKYLYDETGFGHQVEDILGGYKDTPSEKEIVEKTGIKWFDAADIADLQKGYTLSGNQNDEYYEIRELKII